MRFRCFILLLAGTIMMQVHLALADVPGPKEIRRQLVVALEKRSLTDSLYKVLEVEKTKSPLYTCYLGVLQALKAKHAWNPYYKVKHLKAADKTLQLAVSREPDNIEIRFMRFSIEHNLPSFLGYTKHLVSDREEMIKQLEKKHYATADKELVIAIVKFLLESKRCTASENNMLQKQLAALQ